MSTERDFTEGPILPSLIKFVIPVIASFLLQVTYGAVDLIIVGRFGDSTSVSAVGTGTEAMYLVTFIIMGLTMGASVLIGQCIGKKDAEATGDAVGAACGLFIVIGVALTIFMLAITTPLCHLMRVPEESFDKTIQYIRICSLGIIFITAYNVIAGVFRGIGNSKLPMLFVAISSVLNVIVDLILVAGFHLDAAGAAIATVFSQAVSVVISFVIIWKQDLSFEVKKENIKFWSKDTKAILKLGTPLALQDGLTHVSFIVANSFSNSLGLTASAGYGVGVKVADFLILIPMSVGSAVTAMVSQNVGAEKHDRARESMFKAMLFGVCFGIVMWCIGFFFAPNFASIFTSDEAVIEQATLQIRGLSFDCILTNILFAFIGFFNGYGKTIIVMIQGVATAFLVRVPLIWFFSTKEWRSLFYFGLATPIASLVGIIFFIICYKKYKR